MTNFFIRLTIAVAMMVAVAGSSFASNNAAVYDVARVDTAPSATAEIDAADWGASTVLSGAFHYPWEAVTAPETRFRAVHDADNFYFVFDVKDDDVLLLDKSIGERETIDAEDRVELFFAPGPIDKQLKGKLPAYYAVEVDAAGRVHDYSMVYYRNIDSSWFMPGLEVTGTKTQSGYHVEGKIPLTSLADLGLITADGTIHAGVYRAEFSGSTDKPDMHWISWVDPQTPEPDFHVDASFGTFRLLK